MTAAIDEIAVGDSGTSKFASGRMNAEALQKAQEHGWVEPSAYNYTFARPQAQDPNVQAAGEASENPTTTSIFKPNWASDAGRYEWDSADTLGDIGPRNERLEQELFHSEFITRAGNKLGKSVPIQLNQQLPS